MLDCSVPPQSGRPASTPHSSSTDPAQLALAAAPPSIDTSGVPRARFSLLLLGTSILLVAITTGLSIATAWRTRANTRQLLRDYAAFAAWSYRERLTADLGESMWLTLNPIGHIPIHLDPRTPPVERLALYRETSLATCHCDSPARPATYFRYGMRSDSLTFDGAPLDTAVANALPVLLRNSLAFASQGRPGIVHGPGKTIVAYGPMPTESGDTIVYGFTFDSLALGAAFDSVLNQASLLPNAVTRGHPNADLLAFEVRDTAGALFHRSSTWPADESEWPYIAQEPLLPLRGGLVVRLTLIPSVAPSLLSGGLPRTPLPLLLLTAILGIAAAAVALVQLRREGELARLRSNFVTGVSHELRTPLAQIRLFLDTLRLRRYDTEAEHQWLVGHLTRETTRLEHLVANVLSISRLERQTTNEVPFETLDLGREAAEAVTAFTPLAASKQVTLEVQGEDGILVQGDSGELRQLLLNLLDNAVKFGPTGQRIELAVGHDDGKALLTLSDQGPGIPAAEQPWIWESYYRGSGAAVRTVGGSGIGLSIVQQIVSRHGGTITVSNRAEGGARFDLRLPLAGNGAR